MSDLEDSSAVLGPDRFAKRLAHNRWQLIKTSLASIIRNSKKEPERYSAVRKPSMTVSDEVYARKPEAKRNSIKPDGK